jgi:hypothetical protein
MRKGIFHMAILLSMLLSACEKEITWELQSEDLSRVVVDAILTNELRPQEIRLSLSNPGMNQARTPAVNAAVTVSDGSSSWEFMESKEDSGLYLSEPFQVVIERVYRLRIIYQADTIAAEAQSVPVTAMDNMLTIHDSIRSLNRFVFQGSGQAAMTKVFYDWSEDTAYCNDYGSNRAQETFYVLDNVDVNEIFSADRELIWFPAGTQVIRQKFSLAESHQEFLRSLLMETDWSGGIFDVQHGNVMTNLSNGALGYFAVCMVVSDTTEVY